MVAILLIMTLNNSVFKHMKTDRQVGLESHNKAENGQIDYSKKQMRKDIYYETRYRDLINKL